MRSSRYGPGTCAYRHRSRARFSSRAAALALSLKVPTVGSFGALPTGLPSFHAPHVGFTLPTLSVIWPYALSLAAVGLVESLLTAELLDRISETESSKQREAVGQGLANVVTGFFGGQPGCAMIGQSLLCVDTGGRGRISTIAAGVWLLLLVVLLHPLMTIMPMAALVATMVVVALTTFDWQSLMPSRLRAWPITETLIMVITTTIIVATSNLALGVLGGATAACVVFVRELVSAVRVEVKTSSDGATVRHDVHGALFFASTGRLIDALATNGPERAIQIDLSKIHMWDASAILAVEEALDRHRADGIDVKLTGLDGASEALHRRIVGRTADAVGNPPAS